MTVTYVVLPLSELPWPHGLGKLEYKQLELRMEALLGSKHLEQAAHQRAFAESAQYRSIVLEELERANWSSDIVDVVAEATASALTAPLLGQRLADETPWRSWARAQAVSSYYVSSWLEAPPTVCSSGFDDGRHRTTYLRLTCPPDTPVLVRSRG